MLLNQQALDTPFTGGLGSFKLYVLVADHLQRHIDNSGEDRPGPVLVSFLSKYGNRYSLSSDQEFHAIDGTVADLSNVFRLDDILELFKVSHERLKNGLGRETSASVLTPLVCPNRLQQQRRDCLQKINFAKASLELDLNRSRKNNVPAAASQPTPKRRNNHADRSAHEIVAGYRVHPVDFLSSPLKAQR